MRDYIRDLMSELDPADSLSILQPNGGRISAETAMRESVRTILSGPERVQVILPAVETACPDMAGDPVDAGLPGIGPQVTFQKSPANGYDPDKQMARCTGAETFAARLFHVPKPLFTVKLPLFVVPIQAVPSAFAAPLPFSCRAHGPLARKTLPPG